MVIESVISQYCWSNSAGGVVWYLTFRKPRRVEAQECTAAKTMDNMTMSGNEFQVNPGTTILHSFFMHEDLTDDSYCSNGV